MTHDSTTLFCFALAGAGHISKERHADLPPHVHRRPRLSDGSGRSVRLRSGLRRGKRLRLGFLPVMERWAVHDPPAQDQLEKAGYQIKLMDLSEAGPLYAGLSQGAVDLFPSAWPDVTQKSYMDKYRTYIEDLGTYYDSAKLCWSVPDYSSMKSIEDIKSHASQIDNKIVGIEPGAGLTKVSQEDVIPAYDLGDMKFLTSSTTGMLAELKKAVDAKNEIVVTLWHPFWANTTFNMRDLKDPKGALGKGGRASLPRARGICAGVPGDREVARLHQDG